MNCLKFFCKLHSLKHCLISESFVPREYCRIRTLENWSVFLTRFSHTLVYVLLFKPPQLFFGFY